MKNWKQKSKIDLVLDRKCLETWSKKQQSDMIDFIFSDFCLSHDDADIEIDVRIAEKIYIRFSAMLKNESPSALSIVKAMERKFFEIDVIKRQVSFEEYVE